MKIHVKDFRVAPGHLVNLKHWPTKVKPFYHSEESYAEKLEAHVAQLSELQGRLYADARESLLVIFQAMDAAGKDGAIKHVMSGVNPQGCQVFSFKAPSVEELSHDFLWRTTRCLPPRGFIGIFNRSYYEEVLVVRVHPELLEKQHLRGSVRHAPRVWDHRFQSINDYEKHLTRNGTHVVKIFLHLSKEEQRLRLLSRITHPDKNWKISLDDIRERERWKDYTAAYQECLAATSSRHSPWFCVPADDKLNARLIISEIIIGALRDLKMKPPASSPTLRRDLPKMRRELGGKP